MPYPQYKASGYEGTRGRPSLQRDLESMSDKTKRERKAKEDERRALEAKVQPKLSRALRTTYSLRQLELKVADLRLLSKKAAASGNKKAADTYKQAAEEYMKQLKERRAAEEKASKKSPTSKPSKES